jgi:hypothetical protein
MLDTSSMPGVWLVRETDERHNALEHHHSLLSSPMAEPFAINITDQAANHLGGLDRYAQRIVLDGIELHLPFMSWGGSARLMKVIDLQEAKANLEQYAVECQTSPVVVTQEGQPIFELLPIRSDDSGFL